MLTEQTKSEHHLMVVKEQLVELQKSCQMYIDIVEPYAQPKTPERKILNRISNTQKMAGMLLHSLNSISPL